MPTFDITPVEVPQEVLDGLKTVPSATVYVGARSFGSALNVCEGLVNFTPFAPGQRFAARARTLRFLPPRADIVAENPGGENGPEHIAMA